VSAHPHSTAEGAGGEARADHANGGGHDRPADILAYEELLGVGVDVVTRSALKPRDDRIRAEAIDL
jgi:hypothetical protein